jgi:glucose-1-phosphate cytidylyltransferase
MKIKNTKVIILCGGLGSRLVEETSVKPKPMVKIGNLPILIHIMRIYYKNGFRNFILALGYKKDFIIKYFKNSKFKEKWNIELINTGKKTLTAKRLLLLKNRLVKDNFFLLTYGDGVSNVNINKLINFHLKHKKIATVTAVRPPARFGELKFNGNIVSKFDEKNQVNSGWINGGFFVFSKKIFNFIPKKKDTMLEREMMKNLTKKKELIAFKHNGFWQCMDTLRDKHLLNSYWKNKKNLW